MPCQQERVVSQWVRLCSVEDVPADGSLMAFEAEGVAVCLAHSRGTLSAVDEACPHRGGPMSEGWLEDGKVVCPWHAWAFDLQTGDCPEERSRTRVYPLRRQADVVFIDLA